MEGKLFIFVAVAISEVFSACSPSDTELENFSKNPRRSLPFEVSVSSKRCPGLNDFYYSWNVYENDEKGRILQQSTTASILINGYEYDSKKCFITNYLITVIVSHYRDMSSFDKASGVFTFEPDQMYMQIEGGVHRPHRRDKDLILDARKLSRDTSYPPWEDPFEGNTVKWQTEPASDGFEFTNDLVQKFPKRYFDFTDIYIFTVTMTRNKIPGYEDVQSAKQVITIVDEDFPEVNLRCVRNCRLPNNLESSVFVAECISQCENVYYTWAVTPDIDKSLIEFGTGYDKIIIKAKAFEEGIQMFVTLSLITIPVIASLTFSSGFVKGNCTINPDTGISGITKFKIICSGFYSPNGLSVSLIYHMLQDEGNTAAQNNDDRSAGAYLKRVLLHEYYFKEVLELYLPPGNPVTLAVVVEDHSFLQAQVSLTARVEQFQPEENIQVYAGLKERVLDRYYTSIASYSIEGLSNNVVQLICCLLEGIKYYKLNEVVARDLHKHMVQAVMRSRTVRLSSALQQLLIIKKILNFKVKTDTVTTKLIGEALLDITIDLHLMTSHEQNIPLPQFYISIVFEIILCIFSDVLKKSDVILGLLGQDLAPHNYDSYDEFVQEKVQIRDDYKSLTNNILIALQTNCLTVLHKSLPDEGGTLHEKEMFTLETRRKLLSSIETHEFVLSHVKFSETKVVLPSKLMQDLRKNYTFIDYQFTIFLNNPFWWHKNVSTLNTRPILFDLFLQCEKIRELTEPFLLHLEILSVPKEMVQGTLSIESVGAYRIELESHVTLVVDFFNDGEHPNDYLVTWSYCVCTEDDFLSTRSKVIKREMSVTNRTMRIENNNGIKLIYLCVKKSTPMLSYRFVLATFSCMYWNYIGQAWDKRGCRVIDPFLSLNGTMICECNHVSLFMGEILAPPTTTILNLEINCTIDSVKNYVMLAFITGLFLLWVVSLVLAHYKDKSMNERNKIYKLDDNVPGDSNPYLIVVFTGIFYDAHTTADVVIRLVGEESKSRPHLLKCEGVTSFERNSQDWFILYAPRYLGKLKKIQLWHNCKGNYPHWYCERVIVQDLKVGEQYCFTVKQWFSVIWGTGRLYGEFRINKPTQKMRKILFRTQFERDMKDKHIWLSILTRDFQSNFNSKERVSTGFCFLFLSMLANVLLYGVPHDAPSDSIDAQNNFTIAAANIIVFIESWLAAIPMSFLIYFFFKNSAPL